MLKKIIQSLTRTFGFEIRRYIPFENKILVNEPNMILAIRRAKKNGIMPASIIDVGAAEGKCTKGALNIWPDAKYCFVEPLEERKNILNSISEANVNVYIAHSALGKEKGTVPFYVSKDLDGSGVSGPNTKGTIREVPVTSANEITAFYKLHLTYLIKLDTHGFETPILEGADHILSQTELLVIECYGIRLQPDSPLFWELCQWMDKKGFGLADIVDILRRPFDQAFWQCDAFFLKKKHPMFSKFNYS